MRRPVNECLSCEADLECSQNEFGPRESES
jgi:hypothetical protein